MMRPDIYTVAQCGKGFLAVMAKPVAGEWIADEFLGIARYGIKRLVSLLEPHAVRELGLSAASEYCESNGIDFVHFPIKDRGIPQSVTKTLATISHLHDRILLGANTVIHCRAGIGRTGLIAASILVRHGHSPVEAFAMVTKARGIAVPDTKEQYDWVVKNKHLLQSK